MQQLNIISTTNAQFDIEFSKIMKKINTKKLSEIEPTFDEFMQVQTVIIDYIKNKKRKVYGGYALDKLLTNINTKLAIYDDFDTPDIEFYTVDPMGDLVTLCDTLHDMGFKNVIGQEAKHRETYSIYVNFQLYCNITYMPANIYMNIRFYKINDLVMVHPWFMNIDFFKMFTDPFFSYWRLEKHFDRYLKLQSTYPLPNVDPQLIINGYDDENFNFLLKLLQNFLASSDTFVLTGFYTYNYYSAFNEVKLNITDSYTCQIPYLEAFTTNYVSDGLAIVDFYNQLPEHLKNKCSHLEFYPFGQFYGYNTVFYYDNSPLLYLFSNNNRCIPFKNVPLNVFDNQTLDFNFINHKKINIASYDFNILHSLVMLLKIRVDKIEDDWVPILYSHINGLVNFRNIYLNNSNKTIFDETIYQSFVIEHKGKVLSPEREKKLIIQFRKKLNKPLIFRYEPGSSNKPGKYFFPNSSGNQIFSSNHSKLKIDNLNYNYVNDLENIESAESDRIKKSTKSTEPTESTESTESTELTEPAKLMNLLEFEEANEIEELIESIELFNSNKFVELDNSANPVVKLSYSAILSKSIK